MAQGTVIKISMDEGTLALGFISTPRRPDPAVWEVDAEVSVVSKVAPSLGLDWPRLSCASIADRDTGIQKSNIAR